MVLKEYNVEVCVTAISGTPAYQQIAEDLKAKISDGTFPIGAALPSTAKLMETYDVSITVVRAAVKELQVEGTVIGQPGKGVYVQHKPTRTRGHDLAKRVDELTETVRQLGERVSELETGKRERRR